MERKCKSGALKCKKWELQGSWSNVREMGKLFKVQNPKGFKHLDAEEIMGLERFYSEDLCKLKEVVKEFELFHGSCSDWAMDLKNILLYHISNNMGYEWGKIIQPRCAACWGGHKKVRHHEVEEDFKKGLWLVQNQPILDSFLVLLKMLEYWNEQNFGLNLTSSTKCRIWCILQLHSLYSRDQTSDNKSSKSCPLYF